MSSKYQSEWQKYAFEPQKNHFADTDMMKSTLTCFDLANPEKNAGAGPPVISDGGNIMYVPADDTNTLIYGITGSGKTRRLIVPYILSCIMAGESIIAPDIKGDFVFGEHASLIRGALDRQGYKTYILDFRTFKGDGYNILRTPYRLYRHNKPDKALEMNAGIIRALSQALYGSSKQDPFWESTANLQLRGILPLIYRYCKSEDKVNFLSVSSFLNEDYEEYIKEVLKGENNNSVEAVQLLSVLAEPEKTKASTTITSMTVIEPFTINKMLLRMMSHSTFKVSDLFREKSCLFIVLPDESPAYDAICGIVMQQINAALLSEATEMGGKLPVRVNFVCDEFCNYKIPNMATYISASRSRNIRWTIVCQSQQQLKDTYENDAATIIANCQNQYFLNSTETSLLNEISARAGTTTMTYSGQPEPLITPQDLQRLRKTAEYTEALYMSKGIFYVTQLPDINRYQLSHTFPVRKYTIPDKNLPEVETFSPLDMYRAYYRKTH